MSPVAVTPPDVRRLLDERAAKRTPTVASGVGPSVDPARIAALVARLGRGKEHRRRTTWPGGTAEIDLVVLSTAERSEAEAEAANAVAARYASPSNTLVASLATAHDRERLVQYLARAIHEPGGGRLCTSGAELAALATDEELEQLFVAYDDLKSEVDPDDDDLSSEEWQALIQAIKKKDETRWSAIVSALPRRSLLTTVGRLASSLAASSPSI